MDRYKKYCTGCGLCESVANCDLEKDDKGFIHPKSSIEFHQKVCPISGIHTIELDKEKIWGKEECVYIGWSNDENVRRKSSSGGILTEVACYLLETQKVDYIIQIGSSKENPIETEVFLSSNSQEVKSHSGSRYCISSTLKNIKELKKGKKYAIIGKPCEMVALRNYMKINPEVKERIPYLLSFFCMGVPSNNAQKDLLRKLECKDCKKIDYRGNGWPGYTTAVDGLNHIHKMTYNESWGNILGRDLMPACKLCIDGIGEMADISCGDAWYITNDNNPDFSEHDGRNVIFARTANGNEILKEMKYSKKITLETYMNFENELPLIQKSQWNRRREMKYRILAMKLLHKEYPQYDKSLLKKYSESLTKKEKFKVLIKTARRIIKKKM